MSLDRNIISIKYPVILNIYAINAAYSPLVILKLTARAMLIAILTTNTIWSMLSYKSQYLYLFLPNMV